MPYDSDLAISVQDLSITYRASFEKAPTLKSALLSRGRGKRGVREIEAIKHASFDVKSGTVLGILGHNGAGKSTMMRAIAGILAPTDGQIVVNGRVSTLLALGVGFNALLTGHENVTLGGLAGGLSRTEIAERYQSIAEFSELGDFLEMPMRTYSSGMFSRLAFAVAVHMEPDILLIDEALSAGDARFKEKAMKKMTELVGQARTMLLVSHALGTIIEMCNDAIWMHHGEVVMRGDPQEVVTAYTKFMKVGDIRAVLEDV